MIKYQVVATTGTYEKDGEKKYLNKRVGAIIQTKYGFRLKMDASFNPAGCPRDEDGSVWLALFEPDDQKKQQPQSAPQQPPPAQGGGGYDPPFDPEDIPFAVPRCYREKVL